MKRTKLLCIALLAVLLLPLASCRGGERYAADISGARVGADIFAYYLDRVAGDPASFGLTVRGTAADIKNKALDLCAEYVAVNTLLTRAGLSLDTLEKTAAAEKTDAEWRLFSVHYEAIGLTKQTITAIETARARRERLFKSIYDTGGTAAVPERELETYFAEHYAAVQIVNGYLFTQAEDGTQIRMTPAEAEALIKRFNLIADAVNAGTPLEEAAEDILARQGGGEQEIGLTVVGSAGSAYPKGFFEAAYALKKGRAAVFVPDEAGSDCIYLIVKGDLFLSEETYYSLRGACLKALKGGDFEQTLRSFAATLSVRPDERVVRRVCAAAGVEIV